MKTSNKILIVTMLVLFSTLAVYNAALTAEYRKGEFRDIYKYFASLNHKNFNSVTVNGASEINVEIIPGDYQVRVHEKSVDYVKVTQQGNELILDIDYPNESNATTSGQHVIISCPDLVRLKTDATYTLNGTVNTNKITQERYMLSRSVLVSGMKLDSLTILQDNASAVDLKGNTIHKLNVTLGLSEGSGPSLSVAGNNVIKQATMNVLHKSVLVLDDVYPNIKLNHSNTAKVVLKGASLSVLKE